MVLIWRMDQQFQTTWFWWRYSNEQNELKLIININISSHLNTNHIFFTFLIKDTLAMKMKLHNWVSQKSILYQKIVIFSQDMQTSEFTEKHAKLYFTRHVTVFSSAALRLLLSIQDLSQTGHVDISLIPNNISCICDMKKTSKFCKIFAQYLSSKVIFSINGAAFGYHTTKYPSLQPVNAS